jgi:hypothetical protein
LSDSAGFWCCEPRVDSTPPQKPESVELFQSCSHSVYDHWIDFEDDLAVCQNLVPLVNIKIGGKWMFIPLKMVLIGIDP